MAILLIQLLDGCQVPLDDFKRQEIKLSNELGTISILLPAQFDTSLVWVNVSDCGPCCDEKMYRFANRNYSLLQETGFFYNEIPDSLFQFTISHKDGKGCDKGWNIKQSSLDSMVSIKETKNTEAFIGGKPLNWKMRELKNIDEHTFLILGYEGEHEYATLRSSTILEAITVQEGEVLNFRYECARSNCTDFIERMTESLNSIRFE